MGVFQELGWAHHIHASERKENSHIRRIHLYIYTGIIISTINAKQAALLGSSARP